MVDGTLLIVQVKAPLLMLLGGADLRVPVSNGLQVHEYFLRSIYSNSSRKDVVTYLLSFIYL